MSPHRIDRNNLERLEIRSVEMQEIMGYIPRWIIRWGTMVITASLIIILICSWFFKYPDILVSTVVLVSETPPAAVVSQERGKLRPLLVKDKQFLKAGDPIAVIDNPADYHHVFVLKEQLADFRSFLRDPAAAPGHLFHQDFILGELQASYEHFLKTSQDFQHFLHLDSHQLRIAAIESQLTLQHELIRHLNRQIELREEELEITRQHLKRQEKMFKKGFVSQSDIELVHGDFLKKQYAFEEEKSSLDNALLQVAQMEESIVDLRLQYLEQKNRWESELKQAYDTLLSQIKQWEHRYILKAPIAGQVTFTTYWSENQFIPAGVTVFSVVPIEPRAIIGRLMLPISGSGKVKIGQRVNIKFANYPFIEYGMVRGQVRSISLVPSENLYLVEVDFPEGLKTNYGSELPFFQQMQGRGEIITEDMRLLERIFPLLRAMIKKE